MCARSNLQLNVFQLSRSILVLVVVVEVELEHEHALPRLSTARAKTDDDFPRIRPPPISIIFLQLPQLFSDASSSQPLAECNSSIPLQIRHVSARATRSLELKTSRYCTPTNTSSFVIAHVLLPSNKNLVQGIPRRVDVAMHASDLTPPASQDQSPCIMCACNISPCEWYNLSYTRHACAL